MEKKLKSFDGTLINYRIKRQQKPFLVFVHGVTGNHTSWLQQLDFFEKRGYSTITFDLRGHGKSGMPLRHDFSIEAMARDLNTILEKENIKKGILLGDCFGGVVCLVFYNLFPKKVDSLIFISSTYKDPLSTNRIPFAKYFKIPLKLIYALIALLARKFKKFKNKSVNYTKIKRWPSWIVIGSSLLLFCNPNAVFSCHKLFLDFDGECILKKIKIRTLIIAGDRDGFFPLRVAKKMKEKIKGAELRVINNE